MATIPSTLQANAITPQMMQEMGRNVDKAYAADSKKIVYKYDVKTLVVYPSERSTLRDYFGRDEVVFAYADSKNNWYPAPITVLNSEEGRMIYHSDMPREIEVPAYTPFEDRLKRKYTQES